MRVSGAVRGRKGVSDPLELELQMVANHCVILGLELRSSVTLVSLALNY